LARLLALGVLIPLPSLAQPVRPRVRGTAAALRAAQLSILDDAGRALPAEAAHPFFWAPFAVIGEGGAAHPASLTAAQPL
jgi:hypothetical protein